MANSPASASDIVTAVQQTASGNTQATFLTLGALNACIGWEVTDIQRQNVRSFRLSLDAGHSRMVCFAGKLHTGSSHHSHPAIHVASGKLAKLTDL